MRFINADIVSKADRGISGLAGEGNQASDLTSARRTLGIQIESMHMLAAALDGPLGRAIMEAVATIRAARGRVIISGIGKSGHIGRKIAATMASTGTPAYFVHPSEASHGDLGMVTADDAVIALSWSGESSELASILAYTRRFRVPLIAVTWNAASTLGKAADIVLELPKVQEACPHGLAPTSSTMLQLAIGDVLAIALLESRGFTAQDFKVFHPGGKLGASLKHVRDVMHQGAAVPLAPLGTSMKEAILLMNQRGFGCLGVLSEDGRLAGIVTDGDLRRHIADDLLVRSVDEVMTRRPKTIRPDALLATAIEMLNAASITALLVVDDERPVGIVHMHDLLRIGVA
ncbi:KpsF/GutQ family sugar-phosphate isomerase [Prosthecodimorpha staleyi]|uniref:KpsF/GutQ family sugar-phosphate isomerase n=1 Tax=Prosthecodimorpha staleyi TaxID=2840188 RepID=A0A947D663_9HYPH|nr:KpsF/GutQ family sugar-phosphate isomerase [Prosthecodimorpha staleyi]MBT9288927.1 KpsF/GutQ family sugar-phosphate isomerase [Prosthecodimorpha staleyi]